MEYRHFNIKKTTTPEELKNQYKKLVLKHHVDRLGNRKVSKEEYLLREKIMSEINVEYARLRKAMSKTNSLNNEIQLKYLKEVQEELVRILETIPQKTKTEIQFQANKMLLAQWQERLKPILPPFLHDTADILITKKIQQFDFEQALNKIDLEKIFRQKFSKRK